MQKAALITRPLKRSPGCSSRGSIPGDIGDAGPVKLNRLSKSSPADDFLWGSVFDEAECDGSIGSALDPGMLAKYEAASLSTGWLISASELGVATEALEYAWC